MREKILEIGRDSSWYLGGYAVSGLIAFISIPILTRLFEPREYGIYSLVVTAIGIASPVFQVWLSSAVLRFYPEYLKKRELGVFYSTVFHFMPHFLLVNFSFLLIIGLFIPLGKYRLIICLGFLVFAFLTIFSVILAILQAHQLSKQYAIFTVFVQFGRCLIGAAIVAFLRAGIAGMFLGWLGVLIIAIPFELSTTPVWKEIRWKNYSPRLMREFMQYGLPLIPAFLLSEILSVSDRFMVQGFKGAYQVGLYSLVYNLIMATVGLVIGALQAGATPVLMKVYENEGEEKTQSLIRNLTRYFLIILLPTVIWLWFVRIPLMKEITSIRYWRSEVAFLPLLLGAFFLGLVWIPAMSFSFKKKTSRYLIPLSVSALSNIGLNFILIPRFGFTGAAWATFISYVLNFIIATFMSLKYLRWHFPWETASKVIFSGGIMGISVFALEKTTITGGVELFVLVVVGIITYLLSLFAFKVFSDSEIQYMRGLIAKVPLIRMFLNARK